MFPAMIPIEEVAESSVFIFLKLFDWHSLVENVSMKESEQVCDYILNPYEKLQENEHATFSNFHILYHQKIFSNRSGFGSKLQKSTLHSRWNSKFPLEKLACQTSSLPCLLILFWKWKSL